MNIVYFCDLVGRAGGLERIVIAKANYLSKKHEVFIVTTNHKEKVYFYPLDSKVKHIDFSDYGYNKSIWFSKKIFQKIIMSIAPDIIIVPTGKESLVLPFFDKKIPKIKEMHFSRNYRKIHYKNANFIKRLIINILDKIELKIYSMYDVVTPLTYEDKELWALNNLKVIYNFRTIKSKQKALLQNKHIITVGRLDYQKGYDMLLKAWEIVCKQDKEWMLNIYGDGPLKNELIMLSKKMKIENRIVFHGNVKNIKQEYLKSSIYVLSSRHEGLPLVLPEAMECGLPIVSFSCPCGPKDIIMNDYNGFLVKNGNIEDLATQLLILMNNDEKRKEMGEKAKEKAKDFDIDFIMNQWEVLFNNLTKGK